MSTETNKALLRRYYDEVLNQGELSVIKELFVANLVEDFTSAVTGSRAAFPDLKVEVDDQFAEGDRVVSRWHATATHRGEFLGVQATGKRITITAIHIHRIEDGKIAQLWEEINLFALMKQLKG